MATLRERPYVQFNFILHVGPGGSSDVHGGFQEWSGLGIELRSTTVRDDAHAKNRVKKITGINKSTDITLKRGVISADVMKAWLNEIRADSNARRDIVTSLQRKVPNEPPQLWKLLRARIIKPASGPLNARSNEIAIEEMVISCERIEVE